MAKIANEIVQLRAEIAKQAQIISLLVNVALQNGFVKVEGDQVKIITKK